MKKTFSKSVSLIIAVVMCLSLFPMSAFAVENPSSWAIQDVADAVSSNLVPQDLQGKYEQATTRTEFAALAVTVYEQVTGKVITGRTKFNDTTDINVEKAAAIGIVKGVGNNNFDPDASLTREQAATMLSRLADVTGLFLARKAATFADNASISSWAIEAVGQMQASGIMGGVGNNTFDPQGAYTREQSIVTILRLYKMLNGESIPAPVDPTEPMPDDPNNPNPTEPTDPTNPTTPTVPAVEALRLYKNEYTDPLIFAKGRTTYHTIWYSTEIFGYAPECETNPYETRLEGNIVVTFSNPNIVSYDGFYSSTRHSSTSTVDDFTIVVTGKNVGTTDVTVSIKGFPEYSLTFTLEVFDDDPVEGTDFVVNFTGGNSVTGEYGYNAPTKVNYQVNYLYSEIEYPNAFYKVMPTFSIQADLESLARAEEECQERLGRTMSNTHTFTFEIYYGGSSHASRYKVTLDENGYGEITITHLPKMTKDSFHTIDLRCYGVTIDLV